VSLILAAAAAPVARRLVVHVTPEMIRHSRLLDILYFVGTFYSFAVLLIALKTPISVRLRDAAARIGKWPFVIAMIYFALLSVVTTLFEFPLSYYAGFMVPHQFDLTNQTFASWMGDFAKGFAVDVLIGAFLAALSCSQSVACGVGGSLCGSARFRSSSSAWSSRR